MTEELFARVERELIRIDPLWARLAGLHVAPGLPDGSAVAEETHRAIIQALLDEPIVVAGPAEREDATDRLALDTGLRRSLPPPGPRAPGGARALEQFLLAELAQFDGDPERIAAVLEDAPRFLGQSREGCEGCSLDEVQIALAAAKRMPGLLDAGAGLASELEMADRLRLESALGLALDAAAEDGGWLLKDLMPAAAPRLPQPLIVGAGATLDQLGAWAEDQLALAVTEDRTEPAGSGEDVILTAERLSAACHQAAEATNQWCPEPVGGGFEIEAAKDWLAPLLPAVALVPAAPLGRGPHRLLFRPGSRMPEKMLAAEVARIHTIDYLPAAWHQSATRRPRLLRPAPEAWAGWQAHAELTSPLLKHTGNAGARTRAAVALVAIGLRSGVLDHAAAKRMTEAESGSDPDTAALQVAHIAADPDAALLPLAGAHAVQAVLHRLSDAMPEPDARVALLSAGPLPAWLIRGL